MGAGCTALTQLHPFFVFMNKQEVLQALRSSREANTIDDTENWREAFRLYNESQGTKLHPRNKCNKCFSAVLEWLQS